MAAYSQHQIQELFQNVFWLSSTSVSDDLSKAQQMREAICILQTSGIWRKPVKQFNRMLYSFMKEGGSYEIGEETMMAIPEEWLDDLSHEKFAKRVKKAREERGKRRREERGRERVTSGSDEEGSGGSGSGGRGRSANRGD